MFYFDNTLLFIAKIQQRNESVCKTLAAFRKFLSSKSEDFEYFTTKMQCGFMFIGIIDNQIQIKSLFLHIGYL